MFNLIEKCLYQLEYWYVKIFIYSIELVEITSCEKNEPHDTKN